MKKLNLIVAAAIFALGANAEVLTPAQAIARVGNASGARRVAARCLDATPQLTVANHGADAELYVFAPAQGGLMIVGAESEAPALLGYSENFVAGEDMPPALEMMLGLYAQEIADVRAGKAAAATSRADDFAYVETICRTQWNQGAPYNESLPKINGAAPNTGCAATALAQVLKAYNSPAQCSGTISYGWNNTTLTEDLSTYKPDWENMLNTYSGTSNPEANRKAVADLMKATGVACKTNFTTGNSGAATAQAAIALVDNFGYDLTAAYLFQKWYALDQWIEMVYNEVAAGHPVLYSGNNERGGAHGFVVDGYKGDGLFHVNWGWSGASDGYYLLTALNPPAQGLGGSSAGYSLDMSAIFGIKPGRTTPLADVPVHLFIEGSFQPNATSVPLGSMAFFTITGTNGRAINRCPVTFTGLGSALIFKSTTDGKEYYAHCDAGYVSNVAPLYGMQYPPVNIPSNLPAGSYLCYPAVWVKDSDKVYPIHYPVDDASNYVSVATVTGGTVYFGTFETGDIKIADVELPSEIQPNTPFYVKGGIENTGTIDFEGSICLGLYSPGRDDVLANLGEVCSKASGKFTTEFDAKVELKDATLASGPYEFAFFDATADNKIIGVRYSVELVGGAEAEALSVREFKCVSKTRENLEFSVTVYAGDTNYSDQFYVEIRREGQTSGYVDLYQSGPMTIGAKQEKTFTLGDEFKDGEYGVTYVARLLYMQDNKRTEVPDCEPVTFKLDDKTSLGEIAADSVAAPLYDLSGRRVAAPAKGNIYIQNRRKIKL